MMKFLSALLLLLVFKPLVSFAAPEEIKLFGDIPKQVCWYQGHSYSEGALLSQFDMLFVCAPKYANQQNSKLVWLKADASGKAIRPEIEDKIRVR